MWPESSLVALSQRQAEPEPSPGRGAEPAARLPTARRRGMLVGMAKPIAKPGKLPRSNSSRMANLEPGSATEKPSCPARQCGEQAANGARAELGRGERGLAGRSHSAGEAGNPAGSNWSRVTNLEPGSATEKPSCPGRQHEEHAAAEPEPSQAAPMDRCLMPTGFVDFKEDGATLVKPEGNP